MYQTEEDKQFCLQVIHDFWLDIVKDEDFKKLQAAAKKFTKESI